MITIARTEKPSENIVGQNWCPAHDEGRGAWLPVKAFSKSENNRCYCLECSRVIRRLRYDAHGSYSSDRYNVCKTSAANRGIVFESTFEQYKEIVAQPCIYGSDSRRANGVDRKDSSLGYTLDNSAPCCARHNRIKSDLFTYKEMLHIVKTCLSAKSCVYGWTKKKKSRKADLNQQGYIN